MELGATTTPDLLLQSCHSQQQAAPKIHPVRHELPTVIDVEVALRRVSPHKKGGDDQVLGGFLHWAAPAIAQEVTCLFVKIIGAQAEPLAFKGGRLAPIHKRGSRLEAANYRGVLLLPGLSKVLHSLLRRQIIDRLEPVRPPGLIGGFPKQQVIFGSHRARLFTRVASAHGISSGILFIDLSQAYHRLIRTLSVGLGDRGLHDFDACIRALEPAAQLEFVRSALSPSLLEQLFEGQAILLLLQEIHLDTFFHLHHDVARVTRTSRGSRPGSPLADVIFSCAMIRIHEDLERLVRSHPSVTPAATSIGLAPSVSTWADDVAVELCCTSADSLVPLVGEIARSVRRIFASKGMLVNLGPTKTSAVLTFKGRGAPAARTRHLVEEKGCHVTDDDFGSFWLPFVARYKHLGTAFSTEGDLAHEVAERIGAASSALVSMRKPLIGNRKLNTKTRHSLAEALICSRLLFGAGAWHVLSGRVQHRLHAFLTKLFREVYDAQFWRATGTHTVPADDQLYGDNLVQEIEVRLVRHRLCYAAALFAQGSSDLIAAVHAEQRCCPDAWLCAVEADLQWLRALIPDAPFFDDPSWEGHLRFWRERPGAWKLLVHRACSLHLWQSRTIRETFRWHRRIIELLEASGMERMGPSPGQASSVAFRAPLRCHCGRCFASTTALAVHKVHAHGEHAPEWHMAQDTVCGACLRSFWTKARLKQHLAYLPRSGAPNACFEALRQRSFPTSCALAGEPSKIIVVWHDMMPFRLRAPLAWA